MLITCSHLPTGRFKWVEDPDKPKGCISKWAKEAGKGYLLEVDVSYPNHLHDLHSDLPFMCEKMKIKGVPKLIPNLFNNKKYIIHQAIEFDQSA